MTFHRLHGQLPPRPLDGLRNRVYECDRCRDTGFTIKNQEVQGLMIESAVTCEPACPIVERHRAIARAASKMLDDAFVGLDEPTRRRIRDHFADLDDNS